MNYQDKIKPVWEWFSKPQNLAAIALIVGGIWAVYLHFYKSPSPETKPLNTGVQIRGSVTAGRDVVIQNIQITPEHFYAQRKQRLKEIMAEMPQADPERQALLEKERTAIIAEFEDLYKAYEEQKAILTGPYRALDDFKGNFPSDQLDLAKKNLAKGDKAAAKVLFRQAFEKSTEQVKKNKEQAEMSTKQAAEAAYQLGVLAESEIDYGKALRYYMQALELSPNNLPLSECRR